MADLTIYASKDLNFLLKLVLRVRRIRESIIDGVPKDCPARGDAVNELWTLEGELKSKIKEVADDF